MLKLNCYLHSYIKLRIDVDILTFNEDKWQRVTQFSSSNELLNTVIATQLLEDSFSLQDDHHVHKPTFSELL